MKWFLVKSFLKKSWVWLKEHWQIPFLVVWSILVYTLTKRNTDAMIEVIEAKKESYKRELQVLRTSHNDEILKREKLTEEYQRALELIEQKYKEKEKDLTEGHKNEIKEVVIKSKGKPEDVIRRIEREFGFVFKK